MAKEIDPFEIGANEAPLTNVNDAAAGMGSLRRGWESGQATSEANYLAAQEASLRANGKKAEADGLRQKIGALQERAGAFAPQVGRVEDIHGVGDAADWFMGNTGQMAASLRDPLAVSVGMGAAGKLLSMAPNPVAKAVGRGAQILAPAGAYGVNQQQLKGEFVNDSAQDPELMARTSPETLNTRANEYGAGAALLDTALPHVIGSQLVGKGGLRALHGLPGGAKLGATLLGEGGTEAAQEYGKQAMQGQLNPNRDTSGDASALLNSAASGFAGAAGPAAVGVGAEHLYDRASSTARKLGDKAGQAFDLAKEGAQATADSVTEEGKGLVDRLRGIAGGKSEDINLDDGATKDRFQLSPEELSTLSGTPPADIDPRSPAFDDWFVKNNQERTQLAADRLSAMAESDPDAAQHLDAIANAPSTVEQMQATDGAVQFLRQRHDEDNVLQQAEDTSRAAQVAKAAGGVAAKGAMAAGKAAFRFGKALYGGAAEAMSKKNEQTAEAHAGEVFGSYLASSSQASPLASRDKGKHLSGFMHDLGQQLAEVADAKRYDSPASSLALDRIVTAIKTVFKGQADAKLNDLQAMAAPEQKPLFDHIRKALKDATADAGTALRRSAGMTLVGMSAPEQAKALAAHPQGAEQLLGAVEAVIAGRANPPMRRQLEQAVGGRERLNAMIAYMVADKPAPKSGWGDESSTFSAEEADATAAEKNATRGAGPKLYGFHKTGSPRVKGQGSVFDAERGVDSLTGTPTSTRPRLFAPGETLHDGSSAVDKKIADVQKFLKVDTTPERMASTMDEEGKPKAAASVRTAMERAKTDPAVQAKLDEETKAFFVNRAGEHRVEAKSAWDVMKEEGTSPEALVAAYRDYLRQDVKDDAKRATPKLDETGRSAALKEAQAAARYVLDSTRKTDDKSAFRTTPGERKQLLANAEKYFRERSVVVAEQLSNRDPGRISPAELLTMNKATAKTIDFARVAEDSNKVLDEANLITFKKDGKDFPIKAGDLVNWVRTQRKQSETGDFEGAEKGLTSAAKNKAYRDDVMEGVSAVLASGHVDKGMPYKVNAQGKQESFAKGVPPSLRLVTDTAGAAKMPRVKVGEPMDEAARQEAVALEQAHAPEDGDPFAPEADRQIAPADYAAMTSAERAEMNDLPTPEARMAYFKDLSLRKSGERFAESSEGGKTDNEGAVPSEHTKQAEVDDHGRPAAPDEFADQRFRSKTQGFAPEVGIKPESKLHAMRDAAKYGDNIVGQLKGDVQAGLAALESRLRSAERTGKPDAQGLTGGVQYVYPAAYALNRDTIAKLDLAPAGAQKVVALRAKTADIILRSSLEPKEKVALARMMAPAESAGKITIANFRSVLAKAAEQTAAPAASAVDHTAQLDEMLADEDYSKLTSKDRVDRFLRAAKERFEQLRKLDELTEVQKGAYSNLYDLFGKSTFADLASFYDGLPGAENITDDQVRAMLAAPEVAAQGPKSSAAPSGARNTQGTDPSRVVTPQEMEAARDYVAKVLGPQVKVDFEELTGYSGEWVEAADAIKISTTPAPGALSVAYHEALHAFFSKFIKSDPRAFKILQSLAENQGLLDRVHALLAGYPKAQAQLADGEERLAYIFQFWAAGRLDLPGGRPATLLGKVRQFFRRVLGRVSDAERATAILQAFHEGKLSEPSAAGQVIASLMNQGTFTPKQLRKMDKVVQGAHALLTPAENILAKSESKTAQALAREFFTNPGDDVAGKLEPGYLNSTRTVAARYVNAFARSITGLSDRDLRDVADLMQGEVELSDIPYAPHREAVAAIRNQLQEFYKYATENGVQMKHAGEKYFPVTWSLKSLMENRDGFISMLMTHYADRMDAAAKMGRITPLEAAERIHTVLLNRNGTDGKVDVRRDDGVLAPFFANQENRELNWIAPEHRKPFLQKNLVATMTGYFHQGVRAAEYTSRFGANGEILAKKLDQIRNELDEISLRKLNSQEFDDDGQRKAWVERQMANVTKATGAMEGSLGNDISPGLRKFNSWMMAYQNLRLLPLSLFSSFVDPMGMVARGATMSEAYETFLRGMREVVTQWGNLFRENPKINEADKWTALAEHIGAVDAAMLSHHAAEEYSSVYMSPGAKRINDTLFKLNGMEAWNRGMRAGAVRSAVKFIERHSRNVDKTHSMRWLADLGLKPSDVVLDMDGDMILDPKALALAKGISEPEAKRRVAQLHAGINRWVEGAILTPNAAQRPAWASDPHYSLFFHLKQFSYSFHQTILKRAVSELNYGNIAPLGAFVWYIPAMIAADVTKGLIQGGGSLPNHMQGYNLGDWVAQGAMRSGALGIGAIGVDAAHDVFSLAGPGVEQVADAFTAPLNETTLNALPLHGLYGQLLK